MKQFFFSTSALLLFWVLVPSSGALLGSFGEFVPLFRDAGKNGSLFAQTNVKYIDADYSKQEVTFEVFWGSNSRNEEHLDSVWVFVDYQEVDHSTSTGLWKRATVLNATPSPGSPGAVIYDGAHRQGFYLVSPASPGAFSSTLTVALGNMPDQYRWCVYVTDYPPNATVNNGAYKLRGTPPFIVTTAGGTDTLAERTYSAGCITALTDATDCPGKLTYPAFAAGSVSGTVTVSSKNTNPTAATVTAPTGGAGRYFYKWYKNNQEIANATDDTYTLTNNDVSVIGDFMYTRTVGDSLCILNQPSPGTFLVTVDPACSEEGELVGTYGCCGGLALNQSDICITYSTTCGSPAQVGYEFGSTIITCNNGASSLNVQNHDAVSLIHSGAARDTTCWVPNNLCPKGWRWPSYKELRCMFDNRSKLGSFSTGVMYGYWSSVEIYVDAESAHGLFFYNQGQQFSAKKNTKRFVRCVKGVN